MSASQNTKIDRIGRRSRFYRQPTGKRIVLTHRDISIFYLLWKYRYLSSERIVSSIAPKSSKRLIERLGDLYHETHHLDRPAAQWRRAKAEHVPQVYQLTKRGMEALADAVTKQKPTRALPDPTVNFGGAIDRRILQFEHALQISETLFDIGEPISKSSTSRFVTEQEILTKASHKLGRTIQRAQMRVTIVRSKYAPLQKTALQTIIVPDALFGIASQSGSSSTYRFYALEVERSNPTVRRSLGKPSALKKLLAYQALLRSGTLESQLSLPNLFLIIAASSPDKLLKIKALAEEIWTQDEQKLLLFAPPVPIQKLWRSNSELPIAFEEITQKWFEHFRA